MECRDALILLSGHVDHENSPEQEAALQAHLETCPECRKLLEAYEALHQGLSEEVPVPEGFTESVMANLPKRKKRFRLGIPLGTAAGLAASFLVLGVGISMLTGGRKSVSEAVGSDAREDLVLSAVAENVAETQEQVDALMPYGSFHDPANALVPDPAEGSETSGFSTNGYKRAGAVLDEDTMEDAYCIRLSLEQNAAVLRYTGPGADFPALVGEVSPALGAVLEALDFTAAEDGILAAETNYQTLMALQEWLDGVLIPAPEDLEDFGSHSYGYLGSVIELRDPLYLGTLPADWPEGFREQWLQGENWALYFPREDFLPEPEDPAWLVLVPDVQPEP